jgi:3-isopropylmalate/(R)-2-methylmalate dehydratase large subunit
MGARGGMIAPDDKTFEYIKEKEFTPKFDKWDKAMEYWKTLKTDPNAVFDKEISFGGSSITPMITYGTNPGMGMGISNEIPKVDDQNSASKSYFKSLNYMNYDEGESMLGKKIDFVFLGSCTNGRIEDFRDFAKIIKGRKKANNVTAWLVPGSHQVEKAIKDEGILATLTESGFELREPGCSACLAMNDDKIPKGKYAVSTSNRNFEGRQGPGSRTILASPLVAAAAAVTGVITDPRTLF